jgi:predicted RNase H-like HicB family nuclease
MNRYLIIIEKTGTGFSAYSPDLIGCAATGTTRDEVESEMQSAIEFHLDGIRETGEPIPEPASEAAYCEASV